MSAQVILTATKGILKGNEFAFTGKTQCVIGRSRTCDVRVSAYDCTVSRVHCQLDIDAPEVTVRDLGSRNGTFVNNELIGRRDNQLDVEQTNPLDQPCRRLEDGDDLRVGDVVFHVRIAPLPVEESLEKAGSTCLTCC